MKYIVTLDSGAKEINSLINGTRSMIIFGTDVRCFPYGNIEEGDTLYFAGNDNTSEIKAKAIVSSVFNSFRLSEEESYEIIIRNQDKLQLPDDLFYKYAGKRYLVLIEVCKVEELKLSHININNFPGAGDWLLMRTFSDLSVPDLRIA